MIEQLLDTRVLLLFLQDDPGLSDALAQRIEAPDRRTLISMASLWELAQKEACGLLHFEPAHRPDFPEILVDEGFDILPVEWATMQRAAALPRHHRDPTDRLLIAEAIARNIPILSLDASFDLYHVERIGA
ncbi:MAG: PIN domain nuclease of toxin-antitoxin system [Akkermansiaceae bacterium]|jgi:PIN domain nuclease of toxin-antitoxin system|nr:type II toxin-antitoxin system VapC family toxin [Akkermansiaceae bacterium]|tara:strand:+ start:2104 stop:2496 length:393 start_codon:yes stop_codon:yes gene_type:complete